MAAQAVRRAAIVTLGCRLNHADTALLTARLERAGFMVVEPDDRPLDVVVFNTCAVTAEAVAKSRKAVRKLRREHSEARIVATGCAAELDPAGFRADGASCTLTNPGKRELETALRCAEVVPRLSCELEAASFRERAYSRFPFRTRAFIKIQEGCNNRCTYCIVPELRGPERSRELDETLADCRQAVAAGFPELVLTGVNTCAYCDSGCDLAGLLAKLDALPGDFRIRLSSTEPHPGDFRLLEAMASHPKVCRFLHLSLQSGCDRILAAMHRRYDTSDFAAFVKRARELVPGIHVGTDVIIGFPGETNADFASGLEFIRSQEFANVHSFIYSPRPGTAAAQLPGRIAPEVARERAARLQQVAQESAARFAASQTGSELPVIFERAENGVARGWSDNYLEVTAPASAVPLGRIVRWTYTASERSVSPYRCSIRHSGATKP